MPPIVNLGTVFQRPSLFMTATTDRQVEKEYKKEEKRVIGCLSQAIQTYLMNSPFSKLETVSLGSYATYKVGKDGLIQDINPNDN